MPTIWPFRKSNPPTEDCDEICYKEIRRHQEATKRAVDLLKEVQRSAEEAQQILEHALEKELASQER